MSRAAGSPPRGAITTLAFGTTVLLWATAYVTHMPAVRAPAPLTLGLLLVGLLAGGVLAGRWLGNVRPVFRVGLLAGCVNLLILGSVLSRESGSGGGELTPAAFIWIPGSLLLTACVMAVGAWIGSRRPTAPPADDPWPFRICVVAVYATGMLIVAGGLVTGREAGLAVEDWPTSFASNMFLLPLARMTGGVFYEHAHRLLGALVGLTTMAAAFVVFRTGKPSGPRLLAALAVVLVIFQGVLGGLRVTTARVAAGGVEHLTAEAETTESVLLRISHGILAQLFLCLLAALAAVNSRAWRQPLEPRPGRTRSSLAALACAAVLIQLVLGAVVRHLGEVDPPMRQTFLMAHAGFALLLVPFLAAVASGYWKRLAMTPPFGRLAPTLLFLAVAQLLLGLTALFLTADENVGLDLSATLTTLHQATGALVLVLTFLLALFSRRGAA